MTSLSTLPSVSSSSSSSTTETKEQVLQKALDNLEARYQELKSRHQRLLDHLKGRDEDFNKEIESFRTKLEESKRLIRTLEDKDLDSKYQISTFKRKENQYIASVAKYKTMARKYYNEAKGIHRSPRANTVNNVPCSPRFDDRGSTTNSDSVRNSPPEQHNYRGSSSLRRPDTTSLVFGIAESHVNLDTIEMDKSPRMARSEYLGSLPSIETGSLMDLDDEKHTKKPKMRLHAASGKKEWNLEEHLNDAISEESLSPGGKDRESDFAGTPASKPNASPSKAKKLGHDLLMANNAVKSSTGVLAEDASYVDKFNQLSQNIVSLRIRAEISKGEFNKDMVRSPVKFTDIGSPDVRQLSLIKYTSIHRRASAFSMINSPMLLKANSSPIFKNKPLFEDFFIIGPTKQDLEAFMLENPDKSRGTVTPKITFSYPSDSASLSQPPRASIPDFTFPFGVDVKRIKSSPSFSGLNPIIYTSSDYEQRSKCFVFPLLSTNFEERQTAPSMGDTIESSNPDHLLYIVCITFKDFITMSGPSEEKKSLSKIKYWEVNKAMCFMTYYPFTNFFFDILMKTLDLLKVERMMKMSQMNHQDLTRHEAVDTRFTSNYFETVVKRNLQTLLKTNVPSFGSSLDFKLLGISTEIPISFNIQEAKLAFSLEANWACTVVFRYISHKDLLWFFTALLLERKLVFLSSNTHMLTATLFVLRSLIKPFKYPFPLIFNLPEVLMVYCDAPGAALIGINKNEEYLKEQELFEQYPSCIFVCLDEEKLYLDADNNVPTIHFNNFEKNLLTLYAKFNASLSTHFVDSKKVKRAAIKKEGPKFNEDLEEKEKGMKILEIFKDAIEKKILSHIPVKPIYKPDQNLDYDEIGRIVTSKAKEVDKKFLKEFVKTQIFIYYLEQHYENVLLIP